MNSKINSLPKLGYSAISPAIVLDWIKPIKKAVIDELLSTENDDGSHDMGHLQRVSSLSRRFACEEGANELVAYTAGMLHDIVNLPKNHPNIKNCSLLASDRARTILGELNFPKELIPNVCHAILAHSFSANVEPKTIEAKCVQDADRMEAIGALGLMRLFYVSGKFGSKLMNEMDPEGYNRKLNDKEYALDHFPLKLFTLRATMKTQAGSRTAQTLSSFLENFRTNIIQDYKNGNKMSSRFGIAEIYHQAGRNNMALFDLNDPFANQRQLDTTKYALDSLLKRDDPYIHKFFEQLKFELNGYQ
jgi:uncharacterized protein